MDRQKWVFTHTQFLFLIFSLIVTLGNSWKCNVIQQIKKLWPYVSLMHLHCLCSHLTPSKPDLQWQTYPFLFLAHDPPLIQGRNRQASCPSERGNSWYLVRDMIKWCPSPKWTLTFTCMGTKFLIKYQMSKNIEHT